MEDWSVTVDCGCKSVLVCTVDAGCVLVWTMGVKVCCKGVLGWTVWMLGWTGCKSVLGWTVDVRVC